MRNAPRSIFQPPEFHPAVLPDQSGRGRAARAFAKIGINAGKKFDPAALTPGMRQAYQDGMADAWKAFAEFKRLSSTLDCGPAPTVSARGRS